MSIDDRLWKIFKKRLGYNDDELKLFRDNPRNEVVLSKSNELMQKRIVFEVVESHGCNSRHKIGDRFILDGAGNYITEECPKKMCAFAVGALGAGVFAMHELFYNNVDPNNIKFNRIGCSDVGVRCGGWGRVIMEMKVEKV